jgi:hypothetical protein
VSAAVLAHDFSDGINTVGIILRNRGGNRSAFGWLLIAPGSAGASRRRLTPTAFCARWGSERLIDLPGQTLFYLMSNAPSPITGIRMALAAVPAAAVMMVTTVSGIGSIP